jgi:hypothetical protein
MISGLGQILPALPEKAGLPEVDLRQSLKDFQRSIAN